MIDAPKKPAKEKSDLWDDEHCADNGEQPYYHTGPDIRDLAHAHELGHVFETVGTIRHIDAVDQTVPALSGNEALIKH